MMDKKLWGGRFTEKTARSVEEFTSSISFDYRLYHYDIQGSIAHCKMLEKQKIIPADEAEKIIQALMEIEKEIEQSEFRFSEELEDIHMHIENRLLEKLGTIGGKLHTARSRNDQITLDIRLYLRAEIDALGDLMDTLLKNLLTVAENNIHSIMPGFTHLRHAQPILLSHHLMAYCQMFLRDRERLQDARKRVNVMPLGSGALAGTSFPVDRDYVSRLLDFPAVSENSLDTVSDRDFIIEFLSAAAIAMMHLSRMSEDLILWSSTEFDYADLPDSFCTGSSMMPQKKNPDVLELIRGKTGRVYGNLLSLLTTMKGLPLSYNRDLQEDKEPLFDSVDTLKGALKVMGELIPQLHFKLENMKASAAKDFSTATDLTDYLVRKGLPFRQAHETVGMLVRYCLDKGKSFPEISLEEYREISSLFQEDVFTVITLENSINSRKAKGGTAREEVERAIRAVRSRMENTKGSR
ncbi:MAG: argininosuccinate lyase [Proteobacteria bacterium]|nr:argininosuccinate lyase [Pseudomonadota bacterium]